MPPVTPVVADYSAALQSVIDTIDAVNPAAGSANMLFVSDGEPNDLQFTDGVAQLRARDVNLSAFGAGSDATIYTLRMIDNEADFFASPEDLVTKFFGRLQLASGGSGSVSTGSTDGLWLEPGLPGVTVYLDDNNNGLLDWTDKDGDLEWDADEGERWTLTAHDDPATELDETGHYRFDGLAPGVYIVREIVPDGWQWIPPTSPLDDESLIAQVPFNGDAMDTISGAVADNNGAALDPDRFELSDSAYYFDGADWMTLDISSIPIGIEARTVSAWVKSADGVGTDNIDMIASWGTTEGNEGFGLSLYRNGEWHAWVGEYGNAVRSRVAANQNWHFLTATYDGTKVAIYVDGRLANSQNRDLNTAATSLVLGTNPGPTHWPAWTFDGVIDDIRIHNRVLGDGEVATLYAWEKSRTVVENGYAVRVDYGEPITNLDFANADEDVDPIVDAGADATVNEGSEFSGSGSFTDPEADSWTATVDYGDGSGVQTLALNVDKTFDLSHTYGDNGTYTVVVTVEDDDTGVGSDELVVTVDNVDPTVDAGPDATVNEGSLFSGSRSFTDPGADTWTATVDYGDGSGVQPLTLNADKTFDLSHTYVDTGTYTVIVTVEDDDAGVGSDELLVTVDNVDPTVSAGADATVNEGSEFSGSGSSSDPGADTWTATVDYGDGSGVQALALNADKTFDLSHTYADNGTYTVTVTVEDDDAGVGSDELVVTVDNVDPTVSAGADATVDESSLFSGSGSFTDPGADTWTATVDYGDGSGVQALTLNGKTFDLSHTYADNGTYTVIVTVEDEDAGSGSDQLVVTVDNVDPVVSAGADQTVDEGSLFSGSGSFTDPGADTWTATVDYGDGSGVQALTLNGKTFDLSHTYADNGTYTVIVTVEDEDAGSGSDQLVVTVDNVDPVVSAGADQTVDEGSLFSGSGSFTDPGADTWTATVDYGDGSGVQALTLTGTTFDLSHTYTDNGTYTVIVTVEDDDTGVGSDELVVTVDNVDPTVDAGADATFNEGSEFSGSGSFSDPGADTWTATVDYGDGSGVQALTLNGKTFELSHSYADDGRYTVIVTVEDDDLDIGSGSFAVTVKNLAPTADAGGPYATTEGIPVTLSAEGSIDPIDNIIQYDWDLDSDGVFETPGRTVTFPATNDGTFVVALRVTDDDGGVDEASAEVEVARVEPIDLGVVDFSRFLGMSLGEGNIWYRITTTRSGQLTTIASAQSGTVNTALYDASRAEPALAISATVDSVQRFDHSVLAGETYLVKVTGNSNDVTLTFANLVNADGEEIQVSGTDGADTFEFIPTGSYTITINGVEYHFDDTQYQTIIFDGSEGDDTAILTGGSDSETARFFPDHGTFGENGFLVTVNDVTAITAHGGGGLDAAFMYDSAGDDEFVCRKGYGKLSGDGFVLETFDFMTNYGYATTRDGGNDVAYMEDAPENDKFKFDWPKADQFFGKMYGGGIYYNRAKNFEQIVATMTEGKNTVRLFDSEGDDSFYGQKDQSRLIGTGFDVAVAGYDTLAVYASAGMDIANLEDSQDDDTTRARSHKITLWGGDDADPTYEIMARKFDEYKFEGKHGGYDRAKLHDTVLNDHAQAEGNSARLYANNGEMDLLYEVAAFEWVRLYASEGEDTMEKEESLDFEFVYDPAMWDESP